MSTSIFRPTAQRTLHLYLLPRVQNVGESRSILRLLQQYGSIEYFKALKHDTLSAPNTIICVFRDVDAAERLAKAKSINFKLAKTAGSGSAADEEERVFELRVQPARVQLRDRINERHFHGPFPLSKVASAAQADLKKRVPRVGLSEINWRGRDRKWRVIGREQAAREENPLYGLMKGGVGGAKEGTKEEDMEKGSGLRAGR